MSDDIGDVQRAFTAYVIERELGSGGMATVYLAHDRKHDRRVAIKILHPDLAAALGAERFLQEIRVTANLQHPHILGLIDSGVIGEDGGDLRRRPYYVMPYVDGESLRQRLDREQQLPISDALRITTEVASAIDYAHRHGIIHRDIKPANILLHDGSAIVADFGIALAISHAGGSRLTETGASIGTPTYMSPEQAFGEKTLTGRTDIYSLGVVTYEMLCGEPPFTGPTMHAILLRAMTEQPRPLISVRPKVPAHVNAAVSHALEKIPADRFGSGREFAEALSNPSFTSVAQAGTTSATPVSRAVAADKRAKLITYAGAAVMVFLLTAALWGWTRPKPAPQVLRYNLAFDSAESIVAGGSYSTRLALSPDGSTLAYVGMGGRRPIMIRSRDELHATPVPGTEGLTTPFFSPDGQRVAALVEGTIRVISLNGAPPTVVTDSLLGVAGGTWSPDGFIYVDGDGYTSLLRIEPKVGAVAKRFTSLDTASGEIDHSWPAALPNGKGVLFTITSVGKKIGNSGMSYSIGVADIPSGKHRVLVNDAVYAQYAPPGYLFYVTTSRTLMAVAFNQSSMNVTGAPATVADGMRLGSLGSVDLAVSNGTLIYGTGVGQGKSEFVWVTRDGKSQAVDSTWQGFFRNPVLSPDGTRVAVEAVASDSTNVWIKRLDQGPTSRLTFDGSLNLSPAWTPDAQSITFTSNAGGSYNVWTKRADGSAPATLQLRATQGVGGTQWSPDGKWLVFGTSRTGQSRILGTRPGTDTMPATLIASKFTQGPPAISPDGRWLAFSSNESGRTEVYVVPFPNTSVAKWAISSQGGDEPVWSHSGRELFYRDGAGNLVALEVRTTPTFSAGHSTALFSALAFRPGAPQPQYAVSADDRRFLMIRPFAGTTAEQLIAVENWGEVIKARMSKTGR